MTCIVFLVLFTSSAVSLHSHGDLHDRIIAVTAEIKQNRDSAYLYVKRGELRYQHASYKKALKDFKRSQRLGYHEDGCNTILQ